MGKKILRLKKKVKETEEPVVKVEEPVVEIEEPVVEIEEPVVEEDFNEQLKKMLSSVPEKPKPLPEPPVSQKIPTSSVGRKARAPVSSRGAKLSSRVGL